MSASAGRPVVALAPAVAAAALATLASACGDDRRGAGPPLASTMRGPDVVLLRVPRAGGRPAAALYPRLDSAAWRARETAPPLARVLAFDAEAGLLAAVDTAGLPVRLDLRLGTVRTAGKAALTALAASGGTFYGVTPAGAVTRLTASGGEWTVRLAPTPQALYPQRDGSVLAAGARGGTGVVWVLRPPTSAPTDSVRVPGGATPVRLGGGDRVYFSGGDQLLAVQARTLAPAAPVPLGAGVRSAAASPSGDRVFVLTDRRAEVQVVDRYAGAVAQTVALPGDARELRVDPLGRYLLVRPAAGDSAWVVAVGTGRVVGAASGAWRADLPLVLPDGTILTARGADVALVDGETLRTRATVAGGAGDFWHLVLWNGFRPRAAGLDQPTSFRAAAQEAPDSAAGADSTAADSAPGADSLAPEPTTPPDTAATTPPPPPQPTVATADVSFGSPQLVGRSGGEVVLDLALPGVAGAQPAPRLRRARAYTVQFAAAPTEREARRALARLRVAGAPLRVVPRAYDQQTVYRVVAGPFATRAKADSVGRAAGAGNYWVYEGAP